MANQDRHSAALPGREPVGYVRRRGSMASVAWFHGRQFGRLLGRLFAACRRGVARHGRLIRCAGIACGALAAVLTAAILGLWWRLENGPIQIDAFTPWLVSAIEENFGNREHVQVGGTQIERTEDGGAAVRIRDIVVRDADGAVVARAPKAEVHLSAASLFSGHLRAVSLNLVGAQLKVRIEHDGRVTVFAGADKHPLATATVPVEVATAGRRTAGLVAPLPPAKAQRAPSIAAAAAAADGSISPRRTSDILAAVLAWVDGIGENGLDGHELRELGLKEGTLTVDDERTGKDWSLDNIRLSLERPSGGGVIVKLGSENPKRPWAIIAAVRPLHDGLRSVEIEARHVPANGLLRAFHLTDGNMQTSLPLSASLRGEIGADGVPRGLTGRIVAERGYIGDGEDRQRPY